jgi:hypothetical protein
MTSGARTASAQPRRTPTLPSHRSFNKLAVNEVNGNELSARGSQHSDHDLLSDKEAQTDDPPCYQHLPCGAAAEPKIRRAQQHKTYLNTQPQHKPELLTHTPHQQY